MELKDTVDMMLSESWTERFKAEYYQLLNRCWNLKKCIVRSEVKMTEFNIDEKKSIIFNVQCEIHNVMKEQLLAMQTYLDTMERRAILEGIELDPNPFTGRCYVPGMFSNPVIQKSDDKAE